MKKRVIGYLLFGLVAYLFFLVCTFPANPAMALLRSKVPQLQMAGVTGTAWSGRAAALQYKGQRLSRVKWSLNPFSLFTGHLEFSIAFDGEGRSGVADVAVGTNGSVTAYDVSVQLPMDDLATAFGAPVSLGGFVDVKLNEVAIAAGTLQRADGELHWRDAAVTAPVAQSLGSFSAQISTEAAGIKAQIRDDGGPLQLEGTARLINNGTYQFNAKANVRDPQQTLLQQALKASGRQEADGRIALQYSGHL